MLIKQTSEPKRSTQTSEEDSTSKVVTSKKWLIILSIIFGFAILCCLIYLGYKMIQISSPSSRASAETSSSTNLYTGWKKYTNNFWGYSLEYPASLYIVVSQNPNDSSLVYIQDTVQPHIPNPVIAEIDCSTNPNKFDAQTWWQKNTPPEAETAIGKKVLASGTNAYETAGIDSTGRYTLYTTTHDTHVCSILFDHIPAYQQETEKISNSFIWN